MFRLKLPPHRQLLPIDREALQCIDECVEEQKATSIAPSTVSMSWESGGGGPKEAIFEVFAGKRITTKTVCFPRPLYSNFQEINHCFRQCPQHEATEAMRSVQEPIQFVCVEKIDANSLSYTSKALFRFAVFPKYEECMSRPRQECENICSGREEIASLNQRFEHYENVHNHDGTTETAGELCECAIVMILMLNSIFSVYSCHSNCTLPKIVQHCGSHEPERLVRNFNRQSIGEEKSAFEARCMLFYRHVDWCDGSTRHRSARTVHRTCLRDV